MALAVVTIRPNSTPQLGLGTVSGAANAHTTLADSSDSSYVQLTQLCRLDSQVIRVGFPTPSIPAGAKVYSVALRRRIQTVVVPDPVNAPPPVCHHWIRTIYGLIEISGQVQRPQKTFFNSTCPTSPVVSEWIEEDLGSIPPPAGQTWDPATTLTGFTYDIGRGDSGTQTLRVSAVYCDVTYQQLSTITVTGPVGSVTSTRPTVMWTYNSLDSQPQEASRIAIYTADQVSAPGFSPFITTPIQASGWTSDQPWTTTSGWVFGEDLLWTLTSDLTDGQFSAYVQVRARWAGQGDFPTSIASTTWTRAATPVSPPPPAVLNSVTFDPTNRRVAVNFQPGGSSPVTDVFTMRYSYDGGPWTDHPLMTYVPADGMNAITQYDYFAPLNVVAQYQVISYTGSPRKAAIAPSNILSATPVGDEHQIIHPTNPLLNTIFPVAAPRSGEGIKVTKRRTQGRFDLLSGDSAEVLPIVVSGPSFGDEYEIDLVFGFGNNGMSGRDELTILWPVIDQLERSGSILLWKKPDGVQLWVSIGAGGSGQDTEETYNAVPGNPRRVAWRRRKLTLTQVNQPIFSQLT